MSFRYWKIPLYCFIFFCIWRSGWMQSANVVISSFPPTVQQGALFNVSVDYEADLYQYGLAARIFLEVIDADTHKILQTLWDDNNRKCYEGPNGQLTFTTSVTGANAIYFNVYISPVEFNSWFINEFESYPTDGTYPYKWEGNGVTHDIYYQGVLIIADNVPGNYCYCSGITYQVFMDAYQKYNDYCGYSSIYGLTPAQMSAFRREWYGIYSRRCAVEAITKYKVGYEIPYTQKEKVRRGDDVQLWRWNGSGHSVIFDSWVRDSANNIIGLNYWSTQSSTNGIGYRTEYFGVGTGLKDDECYYARKVKPVDDDDWLNRYDDDNTRLNPTLVIPQFTPTPTVTPTQTPIIEPTPIMSYDFEGDTEGWAFHPMVINTYDTQCTGADYSYDGHKLGVSTDNSTNRFGFWMSPIAIPGEANRLYKFQWAINTDQSNAVLVPTIRFRINEFPDYSYSLEMVITSTTGEASPPSNGLRIYNQYLMPITSGSFLPAFDVYDFDVLDNGRVFLDELVVSPLVVPTSEWTTIPVPDFSNWLFENGPGPYNNATTSSLSDNALHIGFPLAEDRGFAYWFSPGINWSAGKLNRAKFTLTSNSGPNTILGAVAAGSTDYNWFLRYRFYGATVPDVTGRDYPLYFESFTGTKFYLAYEAMDFETERGGTNSLTAIIVEEH